MPSNTSQPDMPTCTHERRPGTAVCLHCRHAAIEAAKARRQRLLLRGSAAGVVLAVLGAAGALSANVIRGRMQDRGASSAPAQIVATTANSRQTGAPVDSAPTPSRVVLQGEVAPKAAPLVPVIPPGESILRDSVIAVRGDSAVMVAFDRPMLRTRMPVKFEQFVRTTLSEVYGPAADSVLAAIPDGAIAAQGDLLNELPTRGIRIPVSDAWAIAVFPETRPGHDGPLVVRYRASLVARD